VDDVLSDLPFGDEWGRVPAFEIFRSEEHSESAAAGKEAVLLSSSRSSESRGLSTAGHLVALSKPIDPNEGGEAAAGSALYFKGIGWEDRPE
jgi:hypothetical protein